MDILGELRARTEQAEVARVTEELTTVEYEANELKTCKVKQNRETAVRVVHKGRLGFAASSDETKPDKLIANALESAGFADEIGLKFPGPRPAAKVVAFDKKIAELSIPRMVEMGREILDSLLTVTSDARVNVTLARGVNHFTLENQAGAVISTRSSPFIAWAEISIVGENNILILFDMHASTVWDEDYMAFTRRLAENLGRTKRPASVRSERMPVIFSPAASMVLVLPLMAGLNGRSVYTDISPMKGKAGEKLFDEKMTVVDDATLNGRPASAPFDGEGVPHRRNVLIDKGVLKGFYYDLKMASLSGVESTGNGWRSHFAPPVPSPTNLCIQPGAAPLSGMIAGMDKGLLVEDIIGLGQGNRFSGAFSNPLGLAFKIEKGEIAGRVKNASIAGNVYELLTDVGAVSRETIWVDGVFNMPYILLPEVNVTSKEG